ncbi:hypothetical protein AB0E11_27740 [Streptomyces fradiae]|uniref:hypothetical protein n=1 Tax=Streptomyces fradiae TaxID=1906 RepID=UPI0033FAC731
MPHVPTDLLDRIRALEREVALLRGRTQIRPALDQVLNGTVHIGEGGTLDVTSPGGAQLLGVGRFSTGRYGVAMAREDGSGVAVEVGGNSVDAGQMVRLYARGSYPASPIVMDDGYADGYLGRPWVPLPLTTGVDVSSPTERTTHFALMHVQHRILSTSINVYAPADTTIRVQLRLSGPNGYEDIGAPIVAVGGTSGQEISDAQRIKIDRAHGERWRLLVRASRTAGTGTGTVYPFGLWGVNTVAPSEA